MNSKILVWWQQKGYNKNPHIKVVKDVKNLPDAAMMTGSVVRKTGSKGRTKA